MFLSSFSTNLSADNVTNDYPHPVQSHCSVQKRRGDEATVIFCFR